MNVRNEMNEDCDDGYVMIKIWNKLFEVIRVSRMISRRFGR